MVMIKLMGQKVVVRDWERKDLTIYEKWQTGLQEWKSWDAPYFPKDDLQIPSNLNNLEIKIKEKSFSQPRKVLVIANKMDDLLIGTVNAYWISEETNWLAGGIVLFDPASWYGGLGTEALRLWITYQFEARPQIPRFDMHTWSGNKRMMKLAEKLGFQQEGRFRKARFYQGIFYDSVQYGILREEWMQNPNLKLLSE